MTARDDELLAAIWAAPHDDELRQVYADHLERSGEDARAELVRVQCALARLSPSDPQHAPLVRRERDLWARHRKLLRRDLHPLLRGCAFERGFVAPLDDLITGHRLFKHFFALLPLAPLWNLNLRAVDTQMLDQLVASDQFVRVQRLATSGYHDVGSVAASPHARNLVAIRCAYSGSGAESIAALGALPHLTELRLGSCALEERSELVAASEVAPRLRVLHLRSSKLAPAGVTALFGSGRFTHLEDLDLSYARGDAVVASFAASAQLPALRRLRHFGGELTPDAARALASWPHASGLRELDLGGNVSIGAAGLRVLLDAPALADLESLTLYTTTQDDAEMARLLEERFGTCVRPDRWSVRGMRAIAKS